MKLILLGASMLSVENRKKSLAAYFKRASAPDISEEIRSDLAKYGTVLVCGFIERCVEEVILERLQKKAHNRVLNFIKTFFKKGKNYDCESICQLLIRFDKNWELNFREFIEKNEELKTHISSAYTMRNAIAHGGNANRGLEGVKDLFEAAKKIVDGLIEHTI